MILIVVIISGICIDVTTGSGTAGWTVGGLAGFNLESKAKLFGLGAIGFVIVSNLLSLSNLNWVCAIKSSDLVRNSLKNVSFFFFIKGGGATADGVSTEVVRVLLSKILFIWWVGSSISGSGVRALLMSIYVVDEDLMSSIFSNLDSSFFELEYNASRALANCCLAVADVLLFST